MILSKLRRLLDPTALNIVANDPRVRPMLGGEGQLDLTPVVTNIENVILANDAGAFAFCRLEPGRYELHTAFLPEGRGAAVLPTFAEAARYMFAATDCREIVTKVPVPNRAADLMARRAGFRLAFRRAAAWGADDVLYYAMTIDDWTGHDSSLEAEGKAFHQMLEEAKAARGSVLAPHADDQAHDRAVGAACLMAKAGQGAKAVWSYSRWALFAGYQTADLLSETPLIIDVRDAIVGATDGRLEVLQCR